jgi:hypothetical protein
MRMLLFAVVALCACTEPDRHEYSCSGPITVFECLDGVAVGGTGWRRVTSATLACPLPDDYVSVTCTQGCALTVVASESSNVPPLHAPGILCAETPEAHVGDACDADHPCLPTRAVVGADGTVTGQTYLACSNGRCVASDPPPYESSYLDACDATTIQTYGGPRGTGAVVPDPTSRVACLLAWDPVAGVTTSGITFQCLGDWDCPRGALCDDRVPFLGDTSGSAVCKPGPRGVLTPAMLTR